MDTFEEIITPCKEGIAGIGNIPDGWETPWKARRRSRRVRRLPWKGHTCWMILCSTGCCNQTFTSHLLIAPDQLTVHNGSKQPLKLTRLHPHRQQPTLLPLWIASKCLCPLGETILRVD